ILSRLGLKNEARDAWRKAMTAELDSRWKREIRQQLQNSMSVSAPALMSQIDAAINQSRDGDDQALRGLIDRRFEEVRAVGESILITAWAEAAVRKDRTQATRLLFGLRQIGGLLAERGDSLLLDSVQTIVATPHRTLPALIDAHLAYRQARIAYSR